MNFTSAPVSRRASLRCEGPPFHLVLLHDHEMAAKAAQQTILRLVTCPLRQTELHQDQWTFEELSHTQFQEEALEMARSCDLMVVATAARENFPFHVQSWITDWTETRSQKDGVFVFLSPAKASFADALLSGLGAVENLVVFTSILLESKLEAIPRQQVAWIGQHQPQPEGWGINE
jgi:hypothetical protein